MTSYSEYYHQRLNAQAERVKKLEEKPVKALINISGKKRKYEEAMGYMNDYLVVQEPSQENNYNKGKNWIDSYSQNLFNK